VRGPARALALVSVAGARAYIYRGEALVGLVAASTSRHTRRRSRSRCGEFAPGLAHELVLVAQGRRVTIRPGETSLRARTGAADAQRALTAAQGSVSGAQSRSFAAADAPTSSSRCSTSAARPSPRLRQLQGFATPARSARLVVRGRTSRCSRRRRNTGRGPALLAALRALVARGGDSALKSPTSSAAAGGRRRAAEAAAQARIDLSAPVSLEYGGQRVGALEPERLARLLVFHAGARRYATSLARAAARMLTTPLASWAQAAANAARRPREGGRVVPGRDGVDVDAHLSAGNILAAAAAPAGPHRHADLTARPPDLTTEEAPHLGIPASP